jgi:hypothetical protein
MTTEKYFSVSDVMTFLSCRMKWDISSPNRRSLRHKATPRMYLTTGSALHYSIEAAEKHPDESPVRVATEYLAAEREARVEAYRAENGSAPWPAEMEKFDEGAELALGLINQYFEHYGTENPLEDQGLEYLATEVPFKIDISEMTGIEGARFVGTWDGIAVDGQERLFLVENKSYTQKPDLQDLQVHFQTTGYAVAWEMLTGTSLTGALYNGVAKKLIKEPRRLKDRSLSADVSQQTTYHKFVRALAQDGISVHHPKYAKILEKLKGLEDEGDTRFFYREKFYYNQTQIENWTSEFVSIVQEMANEPTIYRTVPYNGCGPQGSDCWYRDVCFAQHTGQDVDQLITKRYETGSYGTIEAVSGIESIMVASVEDLREALKQHD